MKTIRVLVIGLIAFLSLAATPVAAVPTVASIENKSSWQVRFRFKYSDGSFDGSWVTINDGQTKSKTSLGKPVSGIQVRFLDLTEWKSIGNKDTWSQRQPSGNWSYIVKGRIPQRISMESRATVTAGINGSYKELPGNWSGTEAITSEGGHIYAVQGGKLWRISPSGAYTDLGGGWAGTEAMAGMGGDLYLVQGGRLWRKTPGNSTRTDMGAYWGVANWGGANLMTSHNKIQIYVVRGGHLWGWSKNGFMGDLGDGWADTEAFTSARGYLYLVRGGKLWETNPIAVEDSLELDSNWRGTVALVADNKYIYGLQGGKLRRFDLDTRRSTTMKIQSFGQVRDIDWSQAEGMTSINDQLYILWGGRLWDTWMY